jgi:predicted regulator of Ras-like GTPase activity (Roadblock/LC7/MglB family)
VKREAPVGPILTQLNTVPGVVGSMVCDGQGKVVAHEFPPRFEVARLEQAAAAIADRSSGLDAAVGQVGTIDLRYAMARVIIRPVADGRLLFLCTPSVNLQTLLLSTSGAVRRLEALLAEGDAAAAPAAAPSAPAPRAAGALYRLVQEIDAAIEKSGGDRYKLRGRIALMAGFALDLVDPDSPDEAGKLQKLKQAATVVLGRPF